MRNIIRFTALAVAIAVSVPAGADVTLTGTSSMKGGPFSAEGATTTYIKGAKMRTDSTFRGDLTSMIFDVDGRKMISINHKKKEAEIFDMAVFEKSMSAIDESSVNVTFTPTGESKTIAGEKCDGYTMTITIPFKQEGMPEGLNIIMTGPVFVAKESPAKDEYRDLLHQCGRQGLLLHQSRAGQGATRRRQGIRDPVSRDGEGRRRLRDHHADQVRGRRDDGVDDEQDGRLARDDELFQRVVGAH